MKLKPYRIPATTDAQVPLKNNRVTEIISHGYGKWQQERSVEIPFVRGGASRILAKLFLMCFELVTEKLSNLPYIYDMVPK